MTAERSDDEMYRKILVCCDNSSPSEMAIGKAIELARCFDGEIVGNHVYAARLHDVRFRQLESGLPEECQLPEQLRHQRRVHDKLIEKGLVLIGDSYLGAIERTCSQAGVRLTRQLLEGTHYRELIREANSDGYGLVAMGAHGVGRQPDSQLGGVVSRVMRGIRGDLLIARTDSTLESARYLVCVDGSAYSYRAMRVALELGRRFGSDLYVGSAFDPVFHHVVFDGIKGVLSAEAAKVFKFEEQEKLHDSIIDKGLQKLTQTHLKRALALAAQYPEVRVEARVLVGKPYRAVLQWAEEIDPALLVLARHGAHRVEGSELGSHAENLARLARTNVLIVGVAEIRPDEIPRIDEDGEPGIEWTPDAMLRIQRAPPFAYWIARRAVEDYVIDKYPVAGGASPRVTCDRLDEAIRELLPSHMQLIMGIGAGEELALAEVKAEEAMRRTVVHGSDEEAEAALPMIEVRCPRSDRTALRPRTLDDPIVWTAEAYERLCLVPLIARPLARTTVERFTRAHALLRVTTRVMDENKQAMTEADGFDAETMLVMFRELHSKQLRAVADGVNPTSSDMRTFLEEAGAMGVSRCPLRDVGNAVDRSAEG
jgi:nucleotide-binding universal stress UspA family protein